MPSAESGPPCQHLMHSLIHWAGCGGGDRAFTGGWMEVTEGGLGGMRHPLQPPSGWGHAWPAAGPTMSPLYKKASSLGGSPPC